MKAVKVQYTVKSEYAETNAANIRRVMNELRELNHPGIKYSTFLQNDGRSFVHFAVTDSEESNNILTGLESFKRFQQELKASGPEVPPKSESLDLVASSYDFFV